MAERFFVEAANHRLEAAWFGKRESQLTLILLHEGLGCVALWRDFPEALAARTGCRVLAYSRWGYGGSDPVALPRPLTYMHDEALQSLPTVVAHAGPCVLVAPRKSGSSAYERARAE